MSDISPEDRERLAKTKFKEWFSECFEETFGPAFDKKVGTARSAPQQQSSGQPAPQLQQQQPARKRSLFEECISSALGIG
jgi:hypothetical protein